MSALLDCLVNHTALPAWAPAAVPVVTPAMQECIDIAEVMCLCPDLDQFKVLQRDLVSALWAVRREALS